MRRSASCVFSGAIAAALACGFACATSGDARAATADRFSSLPAGNVPSLADAEQVKAVESGWVDGITVRRPYKRGAVYVQGTDGRCLVASQTGDDAHARPTQSTLYLPLRQTILTARSERLVRDANGARLVVSDVVVDARTFSVKETVRATIALAPLAAHASGFTAYGFKDGNAVEIVATTNGSFQFTSEGNPELDTNDCGHARVRLDVSSPSGDSVVVIGTFIPVELPRTLAPRADEPDPETRMWSVQLGASVSRTKSDAEPVSSLALRVAEQTVDARGRPRM